MSARKLTAFTALVALLSAFIHGVVAEHHSNNESIKTLEPQPLGTATADGALLVSMNYCSVIVNTQCHVSVMTSASGPPQVASSADAVGSNRPVPSASGLSAQTPAGASTKVPLAVDTGSPSHVTGKMTEHFPTATRSSPASPAVTSTALTAAAAGMRLFPGAVWGAAILVVAAML